MAINPYPRTAAFLFKGICRNLYTMNDVFYKGELPGVPQSRCYVFYNRVKASRFKDIFGGVFWDCQGYYLIVFFDE